MSNSKKGSDTAGRTPPNAGKGRPKGALNKNTRLAKDAIATAAERLGGSDRLVEWVKEDPANEKVFWGTIYPKLIPVMIGGDPDGAPVNVNLIQLVALKEGE